MNRTLLTIGMSRHLYKPESFSVAKSTGYIPIKKNKSFLVSVMIE